MGALEVYAQESNQTIDSEIRETKRCTVIDGMAVVQEMGEPNWVRTCDDLAKHFCTQIKQRSSGYDEIHVVFDRYDLDVSLKASTRARRLGGSTPIC